ncbi:MAG TPA: LytTR family DNA-binding domain-containing protein [Gemmatimonadaceae bacterium]|nr:LytTR family DNA-binding domain-containing protein [Gemmatimonadaceae bacterium]
MTQSDAAPIRVLLVDDEPLARRGLRQLLAAHADVAVVGECRDGREALAALDAVRPDLVFLDVQMPELDGFGVIRERGPGRMPLTIFLTAYDEFALPAFEAQALDYLVKPPSEERFAAALARARRQLRLARLDGGASSAAESRLLVPTAHGELVLSPEEIDWIGAEDYYAAVHARGRRHLLRESLAALEARLDPRRFVRVHRSAIVNVARVAALRAAAAGGAAVVRRDGTTLPVSRRRREALARALRGVGGAGAVVG